MSGTDLDLLMMHREDYETDCGGQDMVDLHDEYQVDITSPSQLRNWKFKFLNRRLFDREVKEEISDHGFNRHVS